MEVVGRGMIRTAHVQNKFKIGFLEVVHYPTLSW